MKRRGLTTWPGRIFMVFATLPFVVYSIFIHYLNLLLISSHPKNWVEPLESNKFWSKLCQHLLHIFLGNCSWCNNSFFTLTCRAHIFFYLKKNFFLQFFSTYIFLLYFQVRFSSSSHASASLISTFKTSLNKIWVFNSFAEVFGRYCVYFCSKKTSFSILWEKAA